MLRADNISKSYADRVLFAGINFDIGDRDRVALIGANGSGKTTLFDIVAGVTLPDSGQIIKSKDSTIGYLHQDINPTSKNKLLDEVESASKEIREIAEKIDAIHKALESADTSNHEKLLNQLGALQHSYELGMMSTTKHSPSFPAWGSNKPITNAL